MLRFNLIIQVLFMFSGVLGHAKAPLWLLTETALIGQASVAINGSKSCPKKSNVSGQAHVLANIIVRLGEEYPQFRGNVRNVAKKLQMISVNARFADECQGTDKETFQEMVDTLENLEAELSKLS